MARQCPALRHLLLGSLMMSQLRYLPTLTNTNKHRIMLLYALVQQTAIHHQKSWISRIRCGTLQCHTGEPDRPSFNTKLDRASKYTKLDWVKKYTKLEGLKSIRRWTWPKSTLNWTGPKNIPTAGQGHNLTHDGHSQIIRDQYDPDFYFSTCMQLSFPSHLLTQIKLYCLSRVFNQIKSNQINFFKELLMQS